MAGDKTVQVTGNSSHLFGGKTVQVTGNSSHLFITIEWLLGETGKQVTGSKTGDWKQDR